jgi:hypothetical protein
MYNNPATLHVANTTLIDGVVSWKEFISKVTCINMSSVIEDNNKITELRTILQRENQNS